MEPAMQVKAYEIIDRPTARALGLPLERLGFDDTFVVMAVEDDDGGHTTFADTTNHFLKQVSQDGSLDDVASLARYQAEGWPQEWR